MRVRNRNLFPLIGSIGLSWYSIMITVHGFKVFLPEIILFVFGLAGIPYLLLSQGKKEMKYWAWPITILSLMLISSLFSLKPVVSFKATLRWGECFLAFFLAVNFYWRAKEVRVLLIVMVLLGILQALWGIKLLNSTSSAGGLVSRYLDNPNQMALALDLSLVLVVAFFFATGDVWWKIWWAYCFIFLGITLYLTRSRGAGISNVLVLGLFSLALLYEKTEKEAWMRMLEAIGSVFFKGVVIFFFALLFFVSFAPGSTEKLLKRSISKVDDSFGCRLYYYAIGYRIIEDFPLTGAGGNLYKEVVPYYLSSFTPQDYIETLKKYQLHSLYIMIASEYGILTLMAFFFFLSALGKDVFSSLLSLKGERFWLLTGAGGSVVVWLLHNLVDEGFNFMAIQWGVLLGLAVSMTRSGSQGGESGKGGHFLINVAQGERAGRYIPSAAGPSISSHETLFGRGPINGQTLPSLRISFDQPEDST
jgi:hypothetical protein